MDNSEKLAQNSNDSIAGLVRTYADAVIGGLKKEELDEKNRAEWNHLNHLIDMVHI